MPVIGCVVFALHGKNRHPEIGDDRCSNIVLGRKWIGRTQSNFRTTVLEHTDQIGSLRGDVETRPDTNPFERLLAREAIVDLPDYGHFLSGPLDSPSSFIGS